MQLKVEATGIAHGFTFVVTSPQGCGAGAAVGTAQAQTAGGSLQQENINYDMDL